MNKKMPQFNIISNNNELSSGLGTLTLNDLTSLLIDDNNLVTIDLALIHAKSKVERRIKFSPNKEDLTGGRTYWVVWLTIDTNATSSYYAGIAVCPMITNEDTRRGWKNLAEHVNQMDNALKRKVKLAGLSMTQKQALKEFLMLNDNKKWDLATDTFKKSFDE